MIQIINIQIVDQNKQPLPFDPNTNAFRIPVDPINHVTPKLFFAVVCSISDGFPIQLNCDAININNADFRFTMGNGQVINYIRQGVDQQPFGLPFQLNNLKPPQLCGPADVRIQIQNENQPFHIIRIII
jgi:hypothetical protein